VEPFDGSLQLRKMLSRCFDQQQTLLRGFHFPFPSINRSDRTGKNVYACSQARFHDSVRDAFRFRRAPARDQHYKFIRQDFLPARYSFSQTSFPSLSSSHDRLQYLPEDENIFLKT
jgi:hypothetical protein